MMCKNTYLYLLLGLLFMNCSSDNSNMDNISEEFSVVGSWELTSYTFENSYDFNKDGVASNDFISETACFDDIFINLNADGTGEIIDPNNLSFSFTQVNEYIMNCKPNPVTSSITWSREGDVLTIYEGENYGFNATISGNTFSYTRNADQLVQALFGSEFKDNETIVYTKQ